MTERFEYRATSQSIIDHLTGFVYGGNKKVCDLLNEQNERADRNAEKCWDAISELEKFNKVMLKYEISDVEKLDRILFERTVW